MGPLGVTFGVGVRPTKGLTEKVQCMSASSIHIDYNHAPVQALNSLHAQCAPSLITFGSEVVRKTRVKTLKDRADSPSSPHTAYAHSDTPNPNRGYLLPRGCKERRFPVHLVYSARAAWLPLVVPAAAVGAGAPMLDQRRTKGMRSRSHAPCMSSAAGRASMCIDTGLAGVGLPL